jgi:hypothetical protein
MERQPFSLSDPEYDLSTYYGRFEATRKTINPMFFFNSNSYLHDLKALLDQQKRREDEAKSSTGDRHVMLTKAEITQLRDAQHQTATSFSPDTGAMIPHVGRFSNFIFYNLPISAVFVIAPPTPFFTILGQWTNQTYNAVANYSNRNASTEYKTQDIAKSYLMACTAGCLVALAIRRVFRPLSNRMSGTGLMLFNSITSFTGVAGAGFLNTLFMR